MSGIGFTTAELAQIRTTIFGLLPDTCNLLAVTRTSDDAGGWADTWGTVTGGSALPCRLDFGNTGRESVESAAQLPYQKGILSVQYDAPISTNYRVQIASQLYNVTGENTDQGWLTVRQVIVERVP